MEENNGESHMREDWGASTENEAHGSKPRRKSFAIITAIAVAAIAICVGAYFGYFRPLNEARARFEVAAADVQAKNDELDGAIENLNELATDGGEPLDPATTDAANAAIADARKAERAVPEEPGSADELNAAADKLSEPLDYSAQLASIETARTALEDSIARRALVEQPTGDYVVARLQTLDGVSDVAAVTEENDPNGQLNKAGGYTASVYFRHAWVDWGANYLSGSSIDAGTDGGGCVEVYPTVEDAERRNEYLASFDGNGMLSPGGHEVCGTCVIRTSNYLTASQQQDLTAQMIAALTDTSA
ncbi:MAG: hypothetical protein UHI81_03125 [Olegusella sp.]|nr:hypothetical protein [Olegusella sp.]